MQKAYGFALRIQSILSSAHSDLSPRPPPLPSASRILSSFLCAFSAFLRTFSAFLCTFSAFLCTFSAFFVLSLRSYVFLCVCSLFFISRPDHRLKSRGAGASEFLMVFRFSVASLFLCAPPRCRIYKNPSLPCSRNFGGNNFLSPDRIQNRHSIAKPFCNIIIVYMPRDGSFLLVYFTNFDVLSRDFQGDFRNRSRKTFCENSSVRIFYTRFSQKTQKFM